MLQADIELTEMSWKKKLPHEIMMYGIKTDMLPSTFFARKIKGIYKSYYSIRVKIYYAEILHDKKRSLNNAHYKSSFFAKLMHNGSILLHHYVSN